MQALTYFWTVPPPRSSPPLANDQCQLVAIRWFFVTFFWPTSQPGKPALSKRQLSCHWTKELKWKLNEGRDSQAGCCTRVFKRSISVHSPCLFSAHCHRDWLRVAWSQGIRKWVIFSRTRDFPDVYVIRSFCSSAEIVGFIPHDVRLWPRLGRCCWENEINQGGSTSALVPLPTLPPPSFRIYTQLNLYILGKSNWCPQPIQWSYFFERENHHGWSCQGLNSKLMTDLWKEKIFDYLRTKDKYKGQHQVSFLSLRRQEKCEEF